jgi:hypothetical protein
MNAVLDVKWLPGRYRAPDRVRDGGQVFGHREKGVGKGTGRDEVARSIAGDRLDAVANELEMPSARNRDSRSGGFVGSPGAFNLAPPAGEHGLIHDHCVHVRRGRHDGTS